MTNPAPEPLEKKFKIRWRLLFQCYFINQPNEFYLFHSNWGFIAIGSLNVN